MNKKSTNIVLNLSLFAFLSYFIVFFILYDFKKAVKIIDFNSSSIEDESLENDKVNLLLYFFQKNDTVQSIADKFSISPEILSFNNHKTKDILKEGSLLKVYMGNYIYYSLKEDETLLQVSRNMDIPLDKIVRLNHLNSYDLKKDDILFLKLPSSKYLVKPEYSYKLIHYKTKKNETLIDLSKKFGIPVSEIIKTNSLKSQKLYPGQNLILKTIIKKY